MKKFAAPLLVLGLLTSSPTLAHDTWIVPSATMFSGEQPWVTFDAAVGNDKFYFNHRPLPLNALSITSPSGGTVEPVNTFTGELRSGFDLQLKESGTYRVALVRNGLSAQWREDGKPRRWFGTANAFAQNVPANAEQLKVQERTSRVETFVTKGEPTALPPVHEGLTLAADTHPNDLFNGETAFFVVLMDGQPLADAKVEIVPEGSRYRDSVNQIARTTDQDGRFGVQWPGPGRYWLHLEHTGAATRGSPASQRVASYAVTLEVLP